MNSFQHPKPNLFNLYKTVLTVKSNMNAETPSSYTDQAFLMKTKTKTDQK